MAQNNFSSTSVAQGCQNVGCPSRGLLWGWSGQVFPSAPLRCELSEMVQNLYSSTTFPKSRVWLQGLIFLDTAYILEKYVLGLFCLSLSVMCINPEVFQGDLGRLRWLETTDLLRKGNISLIQLCISTQHIGGALELCWMNEWVNEWTVWMNQTNDSLPSKMLTGLYLCVFLLLDYFRHILRGQKSWQELYVTTTLSKIDSDLFKQ